MHFFCYLKVYKTNVRCIIHDSVSVMFIVMYTSGFIPIYLIEK